MLQPIPATQPPAPKVSLTSMLGAAPNIAHYGINGFIQSALSRGDEVVAASFGPYPALFVSHPELIHRIFIGHKDNYTKDNPLFDLLRPLAGNGIFLAEGEVWRAQRRLVQPEFTRKAVGTMVGDMAKVAAAVATEWDLKRRRGETVDASDAMRDAAMRVICQTVLDVDVTRDAGSLGSALDRLTAVFQILMSVPASIAGPVQLACTPVQKRLIGKLDLLIAAVIDQHRQRGNEGVVNRLLAAPDPTTGEPMSIAQLRDEIMTLFIAGHETTANTMAWVWHLLCTHPEALATLQAELDGVLSGRLPTAADLANLPYTKAVFEEALRLYPPLPILARKAVADDHFFGVPVPAGTMVVPSFFTTHRRPDFWSEPDAFRPERFLPEQRKAIPNYAYVPFGAGPRTCMGNHFAIAEGQVLLATLAQRFAVELATKGTVRPARLPGSLRPNVPIRLRLRPRSN